MFKNTFMFLFDIKYGQMFQTINTNYRQSNDPLYWETVKTYKKVRKAYKGVLCQLIDFKCSNPKFSHLFKPELNQLIKLPLNTKVDNSHISA